MGTGSSITISDDPWLPCATNPRITIVVAGLRNQHVQSFLRTKTRAWDVVLIAYLFNARYRDLILSIPLRNLDVEDSWQWLMDRRGLYSMKSTSLMLDNFDR